MKKLMTMLAAAAMAFGLYADDVAKLTIGTAFEPASTITGYTPTWASDTGLNSSYWVDFTGVTTYSTEGHGDIPVGPDTEAVNRPDVFQKEKDTQYLQIKTTLGTPVKLNAQAAGDPWKIGKDGLYFDGLVNMTVFDEVPGEYSDAKIAVYLLQTNEEDDVQFIVRAKNNGTVKDIAVADADVTDGWHRLTIKVIDDIYETSYAGTHSAGFVIFVDGTAVNSTADKLSADGLNLIAQSYNENGKLFLPLTETTAAGGIVGAAFDGQGSVDELVFTDDPPYFAKNPQVAELVFDVEKGANFMYTTVAEPTDGDWVKATASPLKFGDGEGAIAFPANGKVWLKWDASATYCAGAATQYDIVSGETTTVPGSDYVAAKASFKGLGYADLAAAVAAATEAGELKLLEDATTAITGTDEGVTVNLNGWNLTVEGDGAVAIDSVAGISGAGVITAETAAYGVESIDGSATFNGKVDDCTFAATFTGKVLKSAQENELEAPAGKKWITAGDYYQLDDLATVAFSVQPATNTKATSIKIAGADASTATTITEGQSYEVIFTADEGYTFNGQATATVSDTAGTEAVVVNGPAATAILVTTITVTAAGDATEVDEGATLQLTAAVLPEDALLKDVTWSSSDDNLATVDATSGLVTGVKAGNVTITATAKDASGVTGKIDLEVKAAGPVDPADDDPALIPVNETAAHRYGDRVPEKLANVSAKDLCEWAKGFGELKSGDEIIAEAFLLDCANDEDAVAEAQKEFVFSSIEFKNGEWVVKMINDEKADGQPWKNGQIQVKRYSDVECKTTADDGNFFKATLEPINVPVVE